VKIGRKSFLRSIGTGVIGALAGASVVAGGSRRSLAAYDEQDAEAFWTSVRSHYAIEPGLVYLNTGGLGPAALPVQLAGESIARELQATVETGHARFTEARAALARFLDAGVDELALVRNATEANGIIAAGLSLQAGDEVIFESHAHPGGSFPWLALQGQRGVVVKLFEPDPSSVEGNVARVEAQLTPRTRVVQVSHVTAPTGIVLPVARLAELCRARGIWLHVDGAQSAGMFPFSVAALGCDSYATSGHKWLGAPHETGLLWVRRERLAEVMPPIVGAHSADLAGLPGELKLVPGAARFEYGTRNVAPALAMAAAAAWQDQVGRERIAARGRALVARLRAGLRRIPDVEVLTPDLPELHASMLTFRSPRMPHDRLFERLLRSDRLRCRPVSEQNLDALRVSCHLFNTPTEIDRLLEAVSRVLRAT
jgi:selenocysteine lyase/cysteine desulfurase